MNKFAFLMTMFLFLALSAFSQLQVVHWVNMESEPNYMNNPYDKPTYTAMPVPNGWNYDPKNFDFDSVWNQIEDQETIANPVRTPGGNPFDLGDGDTYGATWKAIYDDSTIYVLFKWIGTSQADDGSVKLYNMFQPVYPWCYEPQIHKYSDDTLLQKSAYGRFVELGGGMAVFSYNEVTEVSANYGLDGDWGSNNHALEKLRNVSHYWNTTEDTTKALMVLPIEALSYPKDPYGDLTKRRPLNVVPGLTKISWEVQSIIKKHDERIQHCWSADKNNVYAMNYYAGYLEFGQKEGEDNTPLYAAERADMDKEPYYMNKPHSKPTYQASPVPVDWKYDPENLKFESLWNKLVREDTINKPIDTSGGDLFNLGNGDTYGTTWKATYDDSTLYVLLQWLGTSLADHGSVKTELRFQPNYPDYYEPQVAWFPKDTSIKKHAWGRFVELGGGNATFAGGRVNSVKASIGRNSIWGTNQHAQDKLSESTHYWDTTNDTTRALLVIPLETFSYPSYPYGDLSNRETLSLISGETQIAWDIKTSIEVQGKKIEYGWSSDNPKVEAINYYAGYLQFVDKIADVTPPVPEETNLPDLTGECEVTITENPTATDNVAGTIAGSTDDPLEYTSEGTYTVTWTYDDGNGNTSTQEQKVIVDDTTAPVPDQAELPDMSAECALVVSETPTATDNCEGPIEAVTNDPLEYTEQGIHLVKWEYEDGNGNKVIQKQVVTIDDVSSPEIVCQDSFSVTLDEEETSYTVKGKELDPVSVNDNCSISEITNNLNNSSTLAGESFEPGTVEITWTVTDVGGNTAQCSFDATVEKAIGMGNSLEQSIAVYPNPANDQLHYKSTGTKILRLSISSLDGKKLVKRSNLQFTGTIGISTLKSGIYILHLESQRGVIKRKIVKK